jgi:hypothetical protein
MKKQAALFCLGLLYVSGGRRGSEGLFGGKLFQVELDVAVDPVV